MRKQLDAFKMTFNTTKFCGANENGPQSQLEHAHRVKDERSAEALTAKRNAADLEQKVCMKINVAHALRCCFLSMPTAVLGTLRTVFSHRLLVNS